MAKKIFTIIILWLSFSMPIFGLSVFVPKNGITSPDVKIKSYEISYDADTSEDILLKIIDVFNNYLWRAFGIVCTAVAIYGWFKLITSNWDKKAMKQWIWAILWSVIGIVIAMLSYMIINLVANLNFS